MKQKALKIITDGAEETKKLGENLAKKLLKEKQKRKKAIVIGLEGELGGGKTTFIQGLAKGLVVKGRITSPTFVIMKKYGIRPLDRGHPLLKNRTPFFFYHIDCYRINKPKDLMDLDFKEIINEPKNIVVIEWADKVKKILPKNSAWIKFEHMGEKKRKVGISIDERICFSATRKSPARIFATMNCSLSSPCSEPCPLAIQRRRKAYHLVIRGL